MQQQLEISISEAARLAEVDRTTLYRKRENGGISFTKDTKGNTVVSLFELDRVYPGSLQRHAAQQPQQQVTQQVQQSATADATANATGATGATAEISLRVKELELESQLKDKELAMVMDQVKDRDQRIDEIRKERDHWQDQASRLLLTHQSAVKPPEKPAEARNDSDEGQDPAKAEKGAKNANMGVYGVLLGVLLLVTVVMNYFQGEIKQFIDMELLGKEKPEPQVEQGREAPISKPQQPYPQSLPDPF